MNNGDIHFELGVKILAMIHAGYITTSCNDCSDKQKIEYGCNEPLDRIVFETDDIELYSCPIKWINQTVAEFYDEFSYYKLFEGTAPKYGDHNIRFFHFSKIYENTYSKYAYGDKKDKQADKKTDNTLKQFKRGFDKKKKDTIK